MGDECLFNHQISFSKVNKLRYSKRKRSLKLTPKLLMHNFPDSCFSFFQQSLFNSLLLSAPFYFRSEAVTGRGSCVTGGCAGIGLLQSPQNTCGRWSRAPGHCRNQYSNTARSHFPPLPRTGKECAVSAFKMQIYLDFILATRGS